MVGHFIFVNNYSTVVYIAGTVANTCNIELFFRNTLRKLLLYREYFQVMNFASYERTLSTQS